jgi:hypothetical protein
MIFLKKVTLMRRWTLSKIRSDKTMKHLTPVENQAMKRSMLMKNWSDEAFNALSLHRFIAITLYEFKHCWVPNLPDTEPFKCWTYPIPNLSDSEPVRFRTYTIPNLSDSEPIRFRTYSIPNLSDSEPIRFRTYPIPNLSDSEPIRFQTSLIPQSPLPLPAHNDHQPLLARPVAKLGTKQSTPVPSPPLSSRWPITPPIGLGLILSRMDWCLPKEVINSYYWKFNN